jgi:hypothetical protein
MFELDRRRMLRGGTSLDRVNVPADAMPFRGADPVRRPFAGP